MINSRNLRDLVPGAANRARIFLAECERQLDPSLHVIVASTYRDFECQAALYARGRTAPGRIVTNARPGESFHNYRVAFDVMIVLHGKMVDDDTPEHKALWAQVGAIGEACGLDWAGRWKSMKEEAHFQLPGQTLVALKSQMQEAA